MDTNPQKGSVFYVLGCYLQNGFPNSDTNSLLNVVDNALDSSSFYLKNPEDRKVLEELANRYFPKKSENPKTSENVTKSYYPVQKTPEQVETKISVPIMFGGKEIILNGGSKEFSEFVRNNYYFPDYVLEKANMQNMFSSNKRNISESEYKITIEYKASSGENIKIIHSRDQWNPSFTFDENYGNYKTGESIFDHQEFAKQFFSEILSENSPNQFYLSKFDAGSPLEVEQKTFVADPKLSDEENKKNQTAVLLENYTEVSKQIAPIIESVISGKYQYNPNSPFVVTNSNPTNQWLNPDFIMFFTIKDEGGSYGIVKTKSGNYDIYPATYYNNPGSRSHGKIEYVGRGESLFPTEEENIRFRKFTKQLKEHGFGRQAQVLDLENLPNI